MTASSPSPPPASSQLLPGRRKLAESPYTWDQLVDIIERKKDLSLLTRSAEDQRIYQAYGLKLKREWKSVYDFILVGKFNFGRRRVPGKDGNGCRCRGAGETPRGAEDGTSSGGLWEAHPPLSQVKDVRRSLSLNDFPYYFPKNIEQWVLWKINGDVTPEEIEQAKRELAWRHGDVEATLHFVNPPHLRSLPGIDHAHILCLRRIDEEN